MNYKQMVKTGYDAIASKYLATRSQDSEDVHLLQDFAARLPRGARVLDAGCGAGVPITKLLSTKFRVVGVDFSQAQLQLARKLVPEARFLCQDLTTLSFPDNSFDGICTYYALIHIPREEHQSLLSDFYRMLKPEGVALLCLGAADLGDDLTNDYFGVTMYWSHYDATANLQMLQGIGFTIIWSRSVTDTLDSNAAHLFVMAQKGSDQP